MTTGEGSTSSVDWSSEIHKGWKTASAMTMMSGNMTPLVGSCSGDLRFPEVGFHFSLVIEEGVPVDRTR